MMNEKECLTGEELIITIPSLAELLKEKVNESIQFLNDINKDFTITIPLN